MELIAHLALGFSIAATPTNLLYAFGGCLLGTAIGVLPGLGPLATIAMLLPFTYGLDPLAALIMLSGIYYGAQYGGSTTAILIKLPGETSAVVTCIDGYEMAKQGRAGVALSTAALVSFFAGCVGTLVLAAFAIPLSEMAIGFGSPEFFSLMVLGLVGASSLASGDLTKAIAMIIVGLLLGLVGVDVESGDARYTFGFLELTDGIDFVSVAVGMFALADIAVALEERSARPISAAQVTTLWPTREDFWRIIPAMFRGTALGSVLGVLPGAGPAIASFGSYALEKKIASEPLRFGKGAIEGVAGPEAANNAAAQTHFVPTLTLGIPGSASMALLLAAMMIHNIQPGPRVITNNPELFWGLIASMWLGNLMLLVLNLPLVGIWVSLLKLPYRFLFPSVIAFCCIGVYSVNSAEFSIYLAAIFGVAGYVFRKLKCEPAPLMLGLVLGPMVEENFRRSLLVSRGSFMIFFSRPVSLVLIILTIALVFTIAVPAFRKLRDDAVRE